ncbi:MAG: hypothetical protein J6U73_02855 [Alistipes sp.]|nr:hypothetical protein [Alistipes sp.]
MLERIKSFLSRLSIRTGIIILIICVVCYIISFAQMLLPISAAAKGVLWFIFFGLAKTTQYTALAILGVKGWRALRTKIKENKQETK